MTAVRTASGRLLGHTSARADQFYPAMPLAGLTAPQPITHVVELAQVTFRISRDTPPHIIVDDQDPFDLPDFIPCGIKKFNTELQMPSDQAPSEEKLREMLAARLLPTIADSIAVQRIESAYYQYRTIVAYRGTIFIAKPE